ncbi:MAG: hypothetical protein KBD66_01050 [Candidatus Doudnabacteria bacterium]|nr:hypothetical protein [Candidatus Doudnabacteria bacterium]
MMHPKKKEELFNLLRDYHASPTPPGLTSGHVQSCVRELDILRDHIMTMIFGLIRGTAPFRDWKSELQTLTTKVKPQTKDSASEREELSMIQIKIVKLSAIVESAEAEQIRVDSAT